MPRKSSKEGYNGFKANWSQGVRQVDWKYKLMLYDTGYLLKEDALELYGKFKKSKKGSREHERLWYQLFGLTRAMCLLLDQAKAFGIPSKDLRLQNFDPEHLLYKPSAYAKKHARR